MVVVQRDALCASLPGGQQGRSGAGRAETPPVQVHSGELEET